VPRDRLIVAKVVLRQSLPARAGNVSDAEKAIRVALDRDRAAVANEHDAVITGSAEILRLELLSARASGARRESDEFKSCDAFMSGREGERHRSVTPSIAPPRPGTVPKRW
jgi:hypothetical protein